MAGFKGRPGGLGATGFRGVKGETGLPGRDGFKGGMGRGGAKGEAVFWRRINSVRHQSDAVVHVLS